ncbi:fluoride efflux transporter CrcB [Capnocytophaga sp.]|uniref:fluoride efflux transporter CrcB n=1 Tax=Capnocytophaga sp. TaxID=44737 RepID=UPI0026DC705B|nr:fluoride efflux transporter CrcB [Capnocytophaga sp.]MDO5106558.1 fluoride efflux transporter CrcB [Capnocytophaga sp.]
MTKLLLFVGLGSGIGGMLRVALSLFVNAKYGKIAGFPIGIVAVNLIGCFLMGFVATYLSKKPDFESLYNFLAIGVLGGFTTFSAFSLETLQLMQQRDFFNAFLYVAISVLAGILACFLGFFIKNSLT